MEQAEVMSILALIFGMTWMNMTKVKLKNLRGLKLERKQMKRLSFLTMIYYIKLIRKRVITDKQSEVAIDKLISNFSKKYVEK